MSTLCHHSAKVIVAGLFMVSLILIAAQPSPAQSSAAPLGSGTQADPYQISTLDNISWMCDTAADSAGKYYSMLADIDASVTAVWNDPETGTDVLEGFKPIGAFSSPDTTSFRGTFEGNDHAITGLTINRPLGNYLGLFGCIGMGGQVANLHLKNVTITGTADVGSLVGSNAGFVLNCSATGTINGVPGTSFRTPSSQLGGLVGHNDHGTVSKSYAACTIAGPSWAVGGLLGGNYYGTVSDCFTTGKLTADYDVGGLVGENRNGTISRCHAETAIAGWPDSAGGLVGSNYSGTISDSHATGPLSGWGQVGGLIGDNHWHSVVSNCYATGVTVGVEYVGGLIGAHEDSTVSDCYATGAVIAESDVGGLIGASWDSTVQYCYASGPVKGNSDVGGLVGYAYWYCSDYPYCPHPSPYSYWNIEASGCSTSAIGTGKTTSAMKQSATFAGWNFDSTWTIFENVSYPCLQSSPPPFKLTVNTSGPGGVSVDPASADGTYAPGTVVTLQPKPDPSCEFVSWVGLRPEEDDSQHGNRPKVTLVMDAHRSVTAVFAKPVKIDSLAQLAKIGNDPDYPLDNVRYELIADIDASETAAWNDAGTDTTVLEGFVPIANSSSSQRLLFQGEFDGRGHTITGLVINRPKASTIGLFGYIGPFGQVHNLVVVNGIVNASANAGGLAGYNAGTVSNCYASSEITGSQYPFNGGAGGGLIGSNSGQVSNCHASGNVIMGRDNIGGLVGYNTGTLNGCSAAGAVAGHFIPNYIGGLVGRSFGTIANSHATGVVVGYARAGGLAGGSQGTVLNSYATGAVTATGTLGGLLGYNRLGTVSYCHATGAVTGSSNSGNVGGLIGYDDIGNVSNSYADNRVEGARAIGGLIGQAYHSALSTCYATSTVRGVTFVGGLIGQTWYGNTANCYATGTVIGSDYVGGLVGLHQYGTLSKCYAMSTVAGLVYIGGLIGYTDEATVLDCYWDTQASRLAISAGGTGKTTAEMKQQATFAGWDFDTIWAVAQDQTYAWLQFSPPPFRLSVQTAGPGSVTADPISTDCTYAPGTVVTVTATPDGADDEFAGWIGAQPSDSPTATAVMDIHKPVMAAFRHRIEIGSLADLTKIGQDPAFPLCDVRYVLTASIDASATASWNDPGTDETILEGFKPIGTYPDRFTGVFDGDGHAISGLAINRPETFDVALFSYLGPGGQVCNLGLRLCKVIGNGDVGSLVGENYSGTISSCYATGLVSGQSWVGGLVGWNQQGIVSDSYAAVAVTSASDGYGKAGGLVGDGTAGTILNCYSTGRVIGKPSGGLVGTNYYPARVFNSYWDTQTSGLTTSFGGTGKNTAEMKQQATFVDWDFENIWTITDNVSYPLLRVFMDSDRDGVPDRLDLCPDTLPGAAVDAQGCPAVIPGDFNHDGIVNQADVGIFSACMTGPATIYDPQNPPPGCPLVSVDGFLPADHDRDGDIDQTDFGILQLCLTDTGSPDNPQ